MRNINVLLGFCCLLFEGACASDPPSSPTPVPAEQGFTLSGTVVDSRLSAIPIAGASVRAARGTAAQTNADGIYELRGLSGEVTVTAWGPHHSAASQSVTLDRDRTLDFSLEHTGVPPFDGTAYISPDVIDSSDPTALRDVAYAGRGERGIYDARVDTVVRINAYLFDVRYAWGSMEFQVNPEFGSRAAARAEVDRFAPALGRVPTFMMAGAETAEISAGDERFAGGSGTFTIHTGRGQVLVSGGYLEEVFFHEAAHVTLDHLHSGTPAWVAAQEADGVFISTYARDYPRGEDVAESSLAWFAARRRAERLAEADRAAILASIPSRLTYFDERLPR